ncbi:MAG: glycosyltransferase family 39 protein [Solirubrobacteraceae bacterium]
MTTATPPKRRSSGSLRSLVELPPIRDVQAPAWFARLPRWLSTGGVLLVLLVVSAVLRSRTLSGQLWLDEASAIGLASHSLGALPGALRAAGSSPFYYVLLHFWINAFGTSERATHALSLIIGLLTIPVAMWVGQSFGGRRAGFFAAVLFAFSSFLTRYAQETQAFELMALLGLLATAGFIHGFVHRRRGFLWLFAISIALMLYTQGAALLYWFGAAVALVVVWRACADRRGLYRDAALCFGGAAIVYLPWLPTSIHQIAHATSPWQYAPLLGATIPSQLLGSERVDVTLLVAVIIVLAPLLVAARRGTSVAVVFWTLIAIPAAAVILARVVGFFLPIWAWRYFAPIVAPLLLLGALACAHARLVGLAAIVLCVAFLANPSSFAPSNKSDMRDVAAEMGPRLHPGDLVVVGQPEQTPLAWYYLPSGLRFADTIGPVADPRSTDWNDAYSRLQDADPQATLAPLVASLKPGQQLLYVRPLTEGVINWKASWAQLVRRRSAQWGAILARDTATGTLKQVAWAPHNYRSACCLANSAMLYQKAP